MQVSAAGSTYDINPGNYVVLTYGFFDVTYGGIVSKVDDKQLELSEDSFKDAGGVSRFRLNRIHRMKVVTLIK